MSDEIIRASHRAESAAATINGAASEIGEHIRQLQFLLGDGYGGNGLRLIELLENFIVPAPLHDLDIKRPISFDGDAMKYLDAEGEVESFYDIEFIVNHAVIFPIDMMIFCPNCGRQHIDEPEPDICKCGHMLHQDHEYLYCSQPECPCLAFIVAWDNPPHKSHQCREEDGGCGLIFRIADVPTNGVAQIKTKGKADTWRQ